MKKENLTTEQYRTKGKRKLSVKARGMIAKAMLTVDAFCMTMLLGTTKVYAVDANTGTIDTFVDFICEWIYKIGGVVALCGGILFAFGWTRDDMDKKNQGLQVAMAGFMAMALSQAPDIFGL